MSDEPAGRCGACAHFHSTRWDAGREQVVGECGNGVWPRVRPETSGCPEFVAFGTLRATLHTDRPKRPRPAGAPRNYEEAPAPRIPRAPVDIEVDMDEQTFRTVLREILRDELALGDATIAERFRGGEIILKPGREGTAEKRVPIDAFFHKIVMLRDKLRVLEQKVNANPKLSDEEKVSMQQYVTGCYGTLTTFNVLFRDEEDRFHGSGEG